ncbi:MAG: hypothetical protein ACKV2U_14090 [Bryobacteraceae bacterium]
MVEAYHARVAPHNPLGPNSLAAGMQFAASIPNFPMLEQVSLGEGIWDCQRGRDLASSLTIT